LYKIENVENMPEYLKKYLIKRNHLTLYNLRNGNSYNLPNFVKSNTQNSLIYKGLNVLKKKHNNVANLHDPKHDPKLEMFITIAERHYACRLMALSSS
jgi:hypothetical protein